MIHFLAKSTLYLYEESRGKCIEISFDLENIKVAGEVGEKLWGIFLKIGYYLQSWYVIFFIYINVYSNQNHNSILFGNMYGFHNKESSPVTL